MSEITKHATGSCLCGAVRFDILGPLRPVIACHCTQCRKQTGHYMSATGTHLDNLNFIENRGLHWYAASASAKRGFCRKCGSTLFWHADDADHIAIAAGTIDGATNLETVAHIFVDDKGDYYALDRMMPQFPRGNAGIPWPE